MLCLASPAAYLLVTEMCAAPCVALLHRRLPADVSDIHHTIARGYFQHTHFIPLVGVVKRGAYELVHDDLPGQQPFGTTLRFTGPMPADSQQ